LKMILGIGRVLSGKLLVYNGLTNEQNVFSITKRERAEEPEKKSALNDSLSCLVSAEEAFSSENTEIIDIRESVEEPHFDSEIVKRVPFSILGPYMKTIPTDRPVYFLCQTGMRSLLAARQYRNQGYQAKSIEGGLLQMQKQMTYETYNIDPGRYIHPNDRRLDRYAPPKNPHWRPQYFPGSGEGGPYRE